MHRNKNYLKRLVPIARKHGAQQTLLLEKPGMGSTFTNVFDGFTVVNTGRVSRQINKSAQSSRGRIH